VNSLSVHPLQPGHPHYAVMVTGLAKAGLPIDDLAEGDATFFAFGDPERPIGFGGIVKMNDLGLIRSLVALERGKGFGAQIVAKLVEKAEEQHLKALWLVTDAAEAFFARQGFQRMQRQNAPPTIRATRQFRNLCPTSAALMVRRLDHN
jgi:N-acetylglutamate synthase-like GNAT family acetyltransferase